MYEETKGRVVCGPGISTEFMVNVGLRRECSSLSPLLFITVMEAISRKTSTRDILRKLPYTDDLAVVAGGERLVQQKELLIIINYNNN